MEGQIRNGGFYDPVRYRYWGYPKAARNERENKRPDTPTHRTISESNALVGGRTNTNNHSQAPTQITASSPEQPQINENPAQKQSQESKDEWDQEFDGLPARHLRPRYLCFLRKSQGYDVRRVKDVIEKDGKDAKLNYIFVSYTRVHFKTWEKKGKEDVCEIAERAAREAGVEAFWLDFQCTPGTTQAEDIHRICDIVRGCHSLIIALGPSPPGSDMALIEWGGRIWTLPELLLCPSDPEIAIYTQGSQFGTECLAKRNFAVRAWKDASAVRQLIDHYEGSLILTPLELVTIALQCMQERLDEMRREPHYKQWAPGDMSYALMGLLRRRPQVNKQDTDFEAFARLSLANDSNLLLERLICMSPPEKGMPWQKIVDAWGVRLWDIYPTCQIAGIGENQTVILDGAYGATIRWKSLAPVAFIRRNTGWRTFVKLVLRGAPAWFLIGLLTLATGAADHIPGISLNPAAIFGIIMFILAMAIILTSPYLLLTTYRGKFWGTQAWFFGIEGYVPIGIIEQNLFGINLGRLKWSTNGSTRSEHHEAKGRSALEGECEAVLPNIPETQQPQTSQSAPPTHDGHERLFTLVDTYSMTVTLLRAVRPPVAVMICGREGGMQRAVLCSYDWRTQTFCRETVLRMKTMVVEKMFRVDRFRFSLIDGQKFRADVEKATKEKEEAERQAAEDKAAAATTSVAGLVAPRD